MRILLLTYGSRGDVQPFVALGVELAARGHDVTLATASRFEGFVAGHGLGFAPLPDEMLALLDTDTGKDLVENTRNAFQTLTHTVQLVRRVGPMQRDLVAASWVAAEGFGPDLVVFHPKTYAGPHIAEKLGIPAMLALLVPMMVPTSERPNMGFADLHSAAWNRFSYRFVNRLMAFSAGKHVRETRAAHGLMRQRRFDLLRTTDGRPLTVLHAHSRSLLPRPIDWGPEAHVTGPWVLDEPDWTPPERLQGFLASGPAPVYVGFGSMAGKSPDRLTRAVVEGLGRAGLRGVIATGWGGLAPEVLPDSVMAIEAAPHGWLFPRMAAIVHHGGAGTTHAASISGRPQVLVPFFGDQPWWARILHARGLCPRPIPQKKLTADRFAEALREATGSSAMREAALRLGAEVAAETGVARAAELIEAEAGRWPG